MEVTSLWVLDVKTQSRRGPIDRAHTQRYWADRAHHERLGDGDLMKTCANARTFGLR
jgi:hypothetical protein